MSGVDFEAKCLTLQYIYKNLQYDEMFSDFAYGYSFEISLADVIASGQMIELAAGGIKLIEETYQALLAYIEDSDNPKALQTKLIRR